MASSIVHSPFFSLCSNRNPLKRQCFLTPKGQSLIQQKPHLLSLRKRTSTTVLFSSLQDQQQEEKSSSPPTSTAVAPAEEAEKISHHASKGSELDEAQKKEEQQEVDWKEDEEFKKFMGNPSIEAALELEKKRVYRTIKQMERETDGGNPVKRLWNNLVRGRLEGEKEMLEKAEETFKALDLNKVFSLSLSPITIFYFLNLIKECN